MSNRESRDAGSPNSVLLKVNGSVDDSQGSPVLERVSKPPNVGSAVNLRDVHDAAPESLKRGVLYRSSQLVKSEELTELGLKVILTAPTLLYCILPALQLSNLGLG